MANQFTSEEGKEKYLNERIGKRFGKLVVVERIGTDKHNNTLWKCKCDCGNTPTISMGALTRGHTKSCGCLKQDKVIDIKGKRFGSWLVLDEPYISTPKGAYWKCKCDCGTIKKVNSNDLRKGISTSCGCSFRLPKGESACKWLYNNYKKQTRGHIFELTLEDFKMITKKNCYYCGAKPNNMTDRTKTTRNGKIYTHSCNGNYIYNGIDRLDNFKGYTKKNSVPCCKICNSMKGKLSKKDFFKHIEKIRQYKIKK